MRLTTTIPCFLIATLVMTSVTNGQRERRRQFVEGLLEGLIESQLEKLVEDDHNSGQPTRPVAPAPAEIQRARGELEHISGALRNLVNVLQAESYTSPAWRQPLAEAMHIKASVDGLYHNSVGVRDIRQLADAYVPVDQQWRTLAHQLSQARGVNRSVLAIVKEVDDHTTEMGMLLGLSPQLDRTELVRLSSTLTTEFRYLLDDISYEMRGHRNQAQFLRQGQQLLTQIRQATAWIDRGDYDSLVQAWKQGQAGWRSYAAELRQQGSERIRRDVMKIEQTGRQITQALWLPLPVDKDYLVHLVSSVETDVDHIMQAVSLKDLMALPNPGGVIRAASELQSSCGSFSQSIRNTSTIDSLVWDFRVFDVAWNDMVEQLRSINNGEVRRHLRDGTEAMALLTQSLGSGPQVSHAEIAQLVSEMGDLCNRTALFVNRDILPSQQVDYRLKNSIQREVIGLQNSVRNLHTRLIDHHSDQTMQQDLAVATTHWNQLKPLMTQCPESAQQVFRQLRGELEPLMVKMQIVYSK